MNDFCFIKISFSIVYRFVFLVSIHSYQGPSQEMYTPLGEKMTGGVTELRNYSQD
jgi:hypothetical protein